MSWSKVNILSINVTRSVTGIISLKMKIYHPLTNESVQFKQDKYGEVISTECSSSHPPHNLPL